MCYKTGQFYLLPTATLTARERAVKLGAPHRPLSRMPRAKTDPNAEPENAETPPLAAFESSVAELETLVESLEAGDLSLEDALARFERGVALARQCQSMLQHAELRVDQLIGESGEDQLAGLDAGNTSDSAER